MPQNHEPEQAEGRSGLDGLFLWLGVALLSMGLILTVLLSWLMQQRFNRLEEEMIVTRAEWVAIELEKQFSQMMIVAESLYDLRDEAMISTWLARHSIDFAAGTQAGEPWRPLSPSPGDSENEDWENLMAKGGVSENADQTRRSQVGFWQSGTRCYMVALSAPVEPESVSQSYLVVRELDESELARLSQFTRADLGFVAPEVSKKSRAVAELNLLGGARVLVTPQENRKTILLVARDMEGSATPGFSFTLPSSITDIARTSARFFQWVAVVQLFLLGILLLLAFRELHLRRELIAIRSREKRELQRARDKAQQADQAKTRFLSVMSHEIRTPLNAVLGFCDLLLRSDLDGNRRNWVGTIQQSGRSLLSLVNEVLDIAKIESGTFTIVEEPFALKNCFDGVVNLFATQAAEAGTSIRWQAGGTWPERVTGDEKRLRQVLINLVSNALKYSAKGAIHIKADLVSAADSANLTLKVVVSDSGPGVPPDRAASLFQDFSQVDESSQQRAAGTGLGLSISRQLCRAMGGDLWLEADRSPGAHFAFAIQLQPAAREESARPTGKARPSFAKLPGPVLVADDDTANRSLLGTLLQQMGQEVITVDNAAAALDHLKSGQSQLAFLDLQLGKASGREVVGALRAAEPSQHAIRLVGVTGVTNEEELAAFRAEGLDAMIIKPLRREAVEKELEMALKSQPQPLPKPEPPEQQPDRELP